MPCIQRGQVIFLEDAGLLGFGDGVLVEDVGGVDRGGRVFGHGGGGELVDVGEADVTFGGDELHEAEDGGVPFGEDAHDGAVAGVRVDGGHDVCDVGALVEEAEGFAELWEVGVLVPGLFCLQIAGAFVLSRGGQRGLPYREGADSVKGVELQPFGHVDWGTGLDEAVEFAEECSEHVVDMVFYVEEGGGGVNGVNLAPAVGMGLDVELGE